MMGNIPPPLLIFIVIVVLSAIIGAVSQILRNQQQSEQSRAARNRSAERDREATASTGKRQGASDIDRFLEEIDKLRKKSAGDASAAPPVVAPPVARRAARPVAAPLPEVPTVEARKPKVPTRVEDLPVAPVVTPPVAPIAPTARPVGAAPPPRQAAKSDFAKQLAGLLTSGQAAPMAVVLNEVLGPPKSRRR